MYNYDRTKRTRFRYKSRSESNGIVKYNVEVIEYKKPSAFPEVDEIIKEKSNC